MRHHGSDPSLRPRADPLIDQIFTIFVHFCTQTSQILMIITNHRCLLLAIVFRRNSHRPESADDLQPPSPSHQ